MKFYIIQPEIPLNPLRRGISVNSAAQLLLFLNMRFQIAFLDYSNTAMLAFEFTFGHACP